MINFGSELELAYAKNTLLRKSLGFYGKNSISD